MSQEKKTKKAAKKNTTEKKKRKIDFALIIIIVGLIIIAIPFAVLGYILISDSMKTGTPIVGDRFTNDLDPAITEQDMTAIESNIKRISGVENVEVVLRTATLRIYVDVQDQKDAEECTLIAEDAYEKATAILSEALYFSQHDNRKMYDIEIHVYNLATNRDSDAFVYVIASKSSSMEEHIVQTVSESKDQELADRLRAEQEERDNPTPTPDEGEETVGGLEEEGQEEEPEE